MQTNDNDDIILSCLLLFVLSVIFISLFTLLQEFVKINEKSLTHWMLNLSTPMLFGRISLDYIGFFIPLVISVILMVFLLGYAPANSDSIHARIMVVCSLTFLTVIPFILIPQLRPFSLSGGPNIFPLFMAPFYLGCLVAKKFSKVAIPLSYVFGFMMGVSSDVASASLTASILGGYGFVDGDFTIPLSFLIATLITIYLMRNYEKMGCAWKWFKKEVG